MKQSDTLVKNSALVASILAVASAFLIVIFVFLAEIGCIIPRQIPLAIVTESAVKDYDGTALTAGFKITRGELIEGHSIEYVSQAQLIEVGRSPNEIEVRVVDRTGADVTNRYNINIKFGSLVVNKRPISIRTGSVKKIYDGTPLECTAYNITRGSVVPEHEIVVKTNASLTSVDTIPNEMTFSVVDGEGDDISDYYDISCQFGTLCVQGMPLFIETNSDNKIYDGVPLQNDEWNLLSGELDKGDSLVVIEKTVFDRVGVVDNVIRFNVVNTSGKDVTDKYNITFKYGTLTVTPKPLSIQMGSISQQYAGTPVYCHEYTMVSGELCEGHTMTVVGTSKSGVGSAFNDMVSYNVTATRSDGTKYDVSSCYKVSYVAGIITVLAP